MGSKPAATGEIGGLKKITVEDAGRPSALGGKTKNPMSKKNSVQPTSMKNMGRLGSMM